MELDTLWAQLKMVDSTVYVGLGTLAATLLLLVFIRSRNGQQRRLPPGPKPWPIIGNIPDLGAKMPHLALHDLSEKYGPVMFLRLGSIPTMVVSSPEMAKEFLVNQGELFASRPASLCGKIIDYGGQSLNSCRDLPVAYLLRKICFSQLFAPKRIDECKDIRTDEIMATVKYILEEGKDGKPVNDVFRKLLAANNNNITRVLFKKSYCNPNVATDKDAGEGQFQDLVTETFNLLTEFFLGNYIPYLASLDFTGIKPRMRKVRSRWDALLGSIIRQHQSRPDGSESSGTREDFVDALLSIREKEKITDDNIKGLVKDMIMGGTSTSTSQTSWSVVEMVHHPDTQKKLQAELDAVVGRHRLVDESDIPKLLYLQAFVNECFRRHLGLPLLLPHQSINPKPIVVAGYTILPKTTLIVNAYSIQMDPAVWKDPLKFNPERFLNNGITVKGQNFEVLPFGSGRRLCPGMVEGLLMVQISVAKLAQCFEWSLTEGTDPSVLDNWGTTGQTVLAPQPIPFTVKPRLPMELYTHHSKGDA